MPKSSNHLALARQWEMLKLLPGRAPGMTARELTARLKEAGYAVTKRTVDGAVAPAGGGSIVPD